METEEEDESSRLTVVGIGSVDERRNCLVREARQSVLWHERHHGIDRGRAPRKSPYGQPDQLRESSWLLVREIGGLLESGRPGTASLSMISSIVGDTGALRGSRPRR
jgi:hypothetical protein